MHVYAAYTLFRLTLAPQLISFRRIRTAGQLALQTWAKNTKSIKARKKEVSTYMCGVDVVKRK